MLKIIINPDKQVAIQIKQALKQNDGFCPCELLKTPDTKCMCKAFREQDTSGPCHCGLYIKQDIPDLNDSEKCVCCGAAIPEGLQVCKRCAKGGDRID